ncbi:hypothetical protein C1H46_014927 [Malus baccata]|uniref:Uncharacterized protein n=1 Tax=Malus baccata TaxID=106549 RepID=A0A540MKY7_MALBA|nr:hypothetical protein C1H46_014927 [Malus baccata]
MALSLHFLQPCHFLEYERCHFSKLRTLAAPLSQTKTPAPISKKYDNLSRATSTISTSMHYLQPLNNTHSSLQKPKTNESLPWKCWHMVAPIFPQRSTLPLTFLNMCPFGDI